MKTTQIIIDNYINENNPYLIATESYLKSVCNEYELDYDNLYIAEEDITCNESFFSSAWNMIKTLIKKAIAFIISLWKKLIEFVKKMIRKAVDFFKDILKIRDKKDLAKEINVNSITFCNPSTQDSSPKYTYKSFNDLKEKYNTSLQSLSKEINIQSKKNIDSMKKLDTNFNKNIKALESSSISLLERVIYNDNIELDNKDGEKINKLRTSLSNHEFNIDDDIVYQNHDFLSTMQVENLDAMSLHDLKVMAKMKDDIYNQYQLMKRSAVLGLYQRFYNDDDYCDLDEKFTQIGIKNQAIHGFVKYLAVLLEDKTPSSQIIDILSDSLFPQFENTPEGEQKIKQFVNLKINWCNAIIESLTNMLNLNQAIFNITNKQYEQLQSEMYKGNFKNIGKLVQPLILKSIYEPKRIIDMREYGLGTFIYSDGVTETDDGRNPMETFLDVEYSTRMLVYLTKYDCTVFSHGSGRALTFYELYWFIRYKSSDDELNLFRKRYREQFRALEKNGINIEKDDLSGEEIDAIVNAVNTNDAFKMTNYGFLSKDIDEDVMNKYDLYSVKDKKVGLVHNRLVQKINSTSIQAWIIQPVYTPSGAGPFIYIPTLLDQLKSEGMRRVLLLSCNPKQIGLPKDIQKDNKLLVTMSTKSTLM